MDALTPSLIPNGHVPALLGPDGRPMIREGENFSLPHPLSFSAVYNFGQRVYSYRWDEAIKHSRENAKAMRRDPFLMGLLQERELATAQLNWHLSPEDPKDPEQMAVADHLTKTVERIPYLQRMLKLTMEATWYGRYGIHFLDGHKRVNGQKTRTVVGYYPLNGDKIQYRYRMSEDGPEIEDGTPAILVNASETERLKDAKFVYTDLNKALLLHNDYWRERFLIHAHEIDDADFFDAEMAGARFGIGIRSRIYWLDWLRLEFGSWIAEFCERAGLGLTVWWYDPANPASYAAAKAASEQQSRNCNILCPRPAGMEKQVGVERHETPMSGAQFLLSWNQHIEEVIERYVVGQSGSASSKTSGMGTHDTDFQQDTKYRLTKFDAANLQDTLTQELVERLKRWNFPDADYQVRWVFEVDQPDSEKRMGAIVQAYGMGVAFKADEVREPTGLSKPQEGDEIVQMPQAQPQQPGAPGMPGDPGAMGGQPPPEQQPPPNGAGGDLSAMLAGGGQPQHFRRQGPPTRYGRQIVGPSRGGFAGSGGVASPKAEAPLPIGTGVQPPQLKAGVPAQKPEHAERPPANQQAERVEAPATIPFPAAAVKQAKPPAPLPTSAQMKSLGMPDDLANDINLLHEEKQWQRAISTPGARVRFAPISGASGAVAALRGVEGVVVRPPEGPHGMMLIRHPYTDENGQEMEVERWYKPTHLEPVVERHSSDGSPDRYAAHPEIDRLRRDVDLLSDMLDRPQNGQKIARDAFGYKPPTRGGENGGAARYALGEQKPPGESVSATGPPAPVIRPRAPKAPPPAAAPAPTYRPPSGRPTLDPDQPVRDVGLPTRRLPSSGSGPSGSQPSGPPSVFPLPTARGPAPSQPPTRPAGDAPALPVAAAKTDRMRGQPSVMGDPFPTDKFPFGSMPPYDVPDQPVQGDPSAEFPRRGPDDDRGQTAMDLEHGKVVGRKNIRGGINETQLVTLDNGRQGIYKPARGEAPGLRDGVRAGTYHLREVAASRVADVLGFDDLVPRTVPREVHGERGSVQHFVPDTMHGGEMASFERYDGPTDAARAAAFDYLIGHLDRHDKNWLMKERGRGEGETGRKIVLIDNGLAFPETYHHYDFYNYDFWQHAIRSDYPIPEDVLAAKDRWPQVRAALEVSGLRPDAIEKTRERFEALTSGRHEKIGDLPDPVYPDQPLSARHG